MLKRFHDHVGRNPEKPALIFLRDGEEDARTLTFAELYQRAVSVSLFLAEKVPQGGRALLLHPPGLEFCSALLGCFYAGVVAIPTYPPASKLNSRSGERFLRLAQQSETTVLLTDRANQARLLAHFKSTNLRILATDQGNLPQSLASPQDTPWPEGDKNDLALIQYSSGSTGLPRGAMLTHANLTANLNAIQARFQLDESSLVVSWLPPYHDMGLMGGILSAFQGGYTLVMMEPRHFLQKPFRWLKAIDRYGADVSGGPNFAFDHCSERISADQRETLDLSRWRLAFCGAETVRARTLRRFAGTFAASGFQAAALFPCYGLAEATLMATAVERGTGLNTVLQSSGGAEMVCCGEPGAGFDLLIVDPDTGRVVPPGTTGEIWLQGESVAQGYWNEPEATRDIFLNRLPGKQGLWLRTGDLGFLQEQGLYVNGRLKDLVVLRGRNYHPADLEDVVSACHPALELHGCIAFSQDDRDLILAAEVRRTARHGLDFQRVIRSVQNALWESFELVANQVVLLSPGSLARTTSGKISRTACKSQFLSGVWKPLTGEARDNSPCEPLSATETRLYQVVAEVSRISVDAIEPGSTLGELGLDSLKRVELAMILEESFRVQFEVEQLLPEMDLVELALALNKAPARDRDSASETRRFQITAQPAQTFPLTPLQAAFLNAAPEDPQGFLEIVYLRIPADVHQPALIRALKGLESRFDALTMRFSRQSGGWVQYTDGRGTGIFVDRVDVSGLTMEEIRLERSLMMQRLKTGFDLSTGPLVKAVLFQRTPPETGVLGLSFHHLVIDAISVSLFVTALSLAYRAILSGREAFYAPATWGPWVLALKTYGQQEAPRQVEYWQSVCGNAPAEDHPRIPDPEKRWALVAHPGLSGVENRSFVNAYPTPLERHHVFLAALAQAWCRVKGEHQPLILLEFHGRKTLGNVNPMTAMGWFVCRYPVSIPGGLPPAELLNTVRQIMQQVPDQGLGYGLLFENATTRSRALGWRRPKVKLVYRGGIDDGFRSQAQFPVIGSESASPAYGEAQEKSGENCFVELYVAMIRGQVSWKVQYSPVHCTEAVALALSAEIATFVRAVSALEPTTLSLKNKSSQRAV